MPMVNQFAVMVMSLAALDQPDSHLFIHGTFELPAQAEVRLELHSTAWFNAFVDGTWWLDGPARFAPTSKEYIQAVKTLPAGKHTLAFQLKANGVDTRIAKRQTPRFFARPFVGEKEIPVQWKVGRSDAYESKKARLTGVLGWIEWCDTRKLPDGWPAQAGTNQVWSAPEFVTEDKSSFTLIDTPPVARIPHEQKPVAQGNLTQARGEAFQKDAGWNFFMRDLSPVLQHDQGVWRRYDLGRVRLAYPRFTLDVPAGTVVEFGYSEYLDHDRVCPVVSQSGRSTCFLDHYVARGGVQTFQPSEPRGMRFLEVHVLCEPGKVRFVKEEVEERTYYTGKPQGSFSCNDELLNRIWAVGVETMRCCYEDAPTDTPTRERGQWLGDVTAAGMDVTAVSYSDLVPIRRMLVQAAQCPEPDGMICGMVPGMGMMIPAFALQWVGATTHYYELTGDRALLEELFDAALTNMTAMKAYSQGGLLTQVRKVWNFIDWGYQTPSNPFPGIDPDYKKALKEDLALSLNWYRALSDLLRWADWIGAGDRVEPFRAAFAESDAAIRRALPTKNLDRMETWYDYGFHATVLSLLYGVMTDEQSAAAVSFIKKHVAASFPNDLNAPVVYCENIMAQKVFTPYFAHYIFDALIRQGEMEFVQQQYRSCWGWFLDQGLTTWPEAFDLRWSHSHQYSAGPTWQLSRYALGLHPRFDLGENHYQFDLRPGSLQQASGRLPVCGKGGKTVDVEWRRSGDRIRVKIITDHPVYLHGAATQVVQINGSYDFEIPVEP